FVQISSCVLYIDTRYYSHGRSTVEPFRDMHGHDVIVEHPRSTADHQNSSSTIFVCVYALQSTSQTHLHLDIYTRAIITDPTTMPVQPPSTLPTFKTALHNRHIIYDYLTHNEQGH